MPEIVVHHLEKSRSHRILWLLEELEASYELKTYARTKAHRAPPELERVHPLGKAPVVVVDGVVYAESGAIVEGLLDQVGKGQLRPEDPDGLRAFRFWLHYAEGSLMPPLLVKLLTGRIRTAPVPFFLRPVVRGIADKVDGSYTDPEVTRHFAFLESSLDGGPWFLGENFSAVDVQLGYPIEAAMARGGDSNKPNLTAWIERCRARPAYIRAEERGGPCGVPG